MVLNYRPPSRADRLRARRMVLDQLRPAHGVLSALPDLAFQALRDHLVPVELHPDQVILEQQELTDRVYFSFSGLYAFVRHLQDGSSIQVALAGNSGLFGLAALFGQGSNALEVRTLVSGWALSIRAPVLASLLKAHPQIRVRLGQLALGLITQVSQTAACNARHTVDQRLALWLMTAADCLGTLELDVTQESIATLLGTRRAGISEALGRLSGGGLVTTARHAIVVTDPHRLRRCACSCYDEGRAWRATQPSSRVNIDPELVSGLPRLMKSCATGDLA